MILFKQYKNSEYDIYSDGRCYSHKTNKFLKPQMSITYPTYNLTLPDGKRKVKIHRMVAETFLSNPDNKPIVNHIDGNTHNFSLENLEWATFSENNIHANKMLLRPKSNQKIDLYTMDLKDEKWLQLKEYPNYAISNKGRVMNIKTKRLLKPARSNSGGYYEVSLWKNNQGKTCRIHSLVYATFSGDYDLQSFVINHIDGDKLNNDFNNLEKITYQNNNLHAEYNINSHNCKKRIYQYDLNNNLINEFESVAQAEKLTGINCLSRAALKGYNAKGYKWKYI